MLKNSIIEQSDDIDLILILNPHSWSTCFLFVKGKTIEFRITHVFGDPYSDLMLGLLAIVNGQESVTFFWYDEPGGEKIEISRVRSQINQIQVMINRFEEVFSKEHQYYKLTIDFEISLKQLVTIFYFQLKKTAFLLQNKEFAETRAKDFPFQEFHKFERLIKQYLD